MSTEDPKRGGKSPTRFMEPPAKAPEKPEPQEEEAPEVDEGVVDALDQQEKEKADGGEDSMLNELGRNPEQPDPRKTPDPRKKDSRSDDAGDCACP